MYKILFFIPTLNEVNTISNIVNEIKVFYPSAHILIIDDDSLDGTIQKLESCKFPNLKLIVRKDRKGIGSAHINAISYAIKNSYNLLITLDGDGTHQVSDAKLIIEKLADFDVVFGSRFLVKHNFINWKKGRIILAKIGHLVTKNGLKVNYDVSSGYRGYNLDKTDYLKILANLNSESYDFFPSSAAAFLATNLRISEIPITVEERKYGHSKMSVTIMIKSVIKLFRLILLNKLKRVN